MSQDSISITLITLGALWLLGLAAQVIGSRTHVPRVTILIAFGMLIGPVGLDLLPDLSLAWFDYITTIALTLIGFLLGGKLSGDAIRTHGVDAFMLSLIITLGTFAVVFAGLKLLGVSTPVALVLAGVSLATDPIATLDVVDNSTARSPLRNFLPPIVALDDAWGLLLFSIVMTLVHMVSNGGIHAEFLLEAILELIGSVALGLALGIPMAALSGRIKAGEPTLIEALGMVMLCAGLSLYFGFSYLLSAIVMGITISALASHHKFAFHEIEHIEWPMLVLFLILVGASFTPGSWMAFSLLGVAYIVLRIVGRVVGAHLYAKAILNRRGKTMLGLALLPQAGVALGTAIYATQQFPEIAQEVVTVTIGATIAFELFGPMLTAWALRETGEET